MRKGFSQPLRLGGFMWAFKQGYCGGDPGVLNPRLESSPITLNRLMVSGSSWKLGGQGLQEGCNPWVNSGPGAWGV